MSGSIRDSEKLHSRQLDTLRRKNERELKFVKDSHDTVKVSQKRSQDAELIDLQQENHQVLSEEEGKKQKLLESMRSHLTTTKDMTEKQLKELKVSSDEEKNKLEVRNGLTREKLVSDNELHLEDINHRFNTQNRKVLSEGHDRVLSAEQTQAELLASKEEHYQKKISAQTQTHSEKIKSDDYRYQKLKTEQDKAFKRERMDTNLRQHSEINKMTGSHESHKKVRDSEFKRDINSQQQFQEKKFMTQKDSHEGQFKNLSDLNRKIINDSKAELASELTLLTDRSKDPFFQFSELRPTLKEHQDHLEVSVAVPEHSKSDMMLTLNNKELVLTFNRRYVDVHKDTQGEQRINKVESLSNRIITQHHLDAKSVKSSYENGIMTYTIKKS